MPTTNELTDLLRDILDTLNTIPNTSVPAMYRREVKFQNTYEICTVIAKTLKG